MSEVNVRNDVEINRIKAIADSGNDKPVLMLNLNFYSEEAAFPDGKLYEDYMSVLENFLPVVGAKILWRHPVFGQVTGEQPLHEVLAAWYPTHQAFLDLPTAPGAEENFRLRALAVERAVIHRAPGEVYPFMP
ncbi:MAG: hypothetical protein AAF384_15150 [Pseudomonadota bacterium]